MAGNNSVTELFGTESARAYFNSLPAAIQETIVQSAGRMTEQELRALAGNLMKKGL